MTFELDITVSVTNLKYSKTQHIAVTDLKENKTWITFITCFSLPATFAFTIEVPLEIFTPDSPFFVTRIRRTLIWQI